MELFFTSSSFLYFLWRARPRVTRLRLDLFSLAALSFQEQRYLRDRKRKKTSSIWIQLWGPLLPSMSRIIWRKTDQAMHCNIFFSTQRNKTSSLVIICGGVKHPVTVIQIGEWLGLGPSRANSENWDIALGDIPGLHTDCRGYVTPWLQN